MARITLECPRCGEQTVVKKLTEEELDALECPHCEVGLRRAVEPEEIKLKPQKPSRATAEKPTKRKPAKKTPRYVFWLLFGSLIVGGPGAVAAIWWFEKKNDPVAQPGPEPDFKAPEPVNHYPTIDPEPTPKAVTPVPGAPELAKTIWLLENDNAVIELAKFEETMQKQGYVRTSRIRDKLHDELLRQSFWLIASRDFGLRVGDENLAAAPPDKLPAERQFRIRGDYCVHKVMEKVMDKNVKVAPWEVFGWALLQGPKETEKKFWEGTTLYDLSHDDKASQRVEEAESQARGLFHKSLKLAGFEPRPLKISDAPVPADAEKLLETLRETDAFAAVRRVHAEVEKQGESPALLSALVRGYAQLGLLTNFHWTGHAAIFKARAMLFAQRLVTRDPKSPTGVWLRAYAAALAGKHFMALEDLKGAVKLAEPANASAPAWVEPVDAYLHFDDARLKAIREKTPTPLVRLLQFLIVDAPHAEIGARAAVRAGRVYLEFNPEGYRVHDSMCRTGGDKDVVAAAQACLKAFTKHFRDRLQEVPGLPEKVRELLDDPKTPPARIFAALRAADGGTTDSGPLPWALLAEVLQDNYYALAWHRLDFQANRVLAPTDRLAAELLEPLAGHPLLPLIENFRFDPHEDGLKVYEKLTAGRTDRIDLHCTGFGHQFRKVAIDEYETWQSNANSRSDDTYEFEAMHVCLAYKLPGARGNAAYFLDKKSPHAPLAIAQHVERGKPEDVAQFGEYERAYGNNLPVLYALGEHHAHNQRPADAIRYWSRCLALVPDWAVYKNLSKAYWDAGQIDQWEATLTAALKEDDLSSYHGLVNKQLADGYVRRQQFDKAEPFAVAAAASGDVEALISAAECKLELRKWDEAERLFRTAVLKDDEKAFDWYFACVRTGQMKLTAAERAVGEYMPKLQGITPQPRVMKLAHFYLMARKPDWAYAQLERANSERTATDMSTLFTAIMADARGDKADRDKAMSHRGWAHNTQFSSAAPILSQFEEWFAVRDAMTEAAMTKSRAHLDEAAQPDWDFFAGWYLYNRGAADRATAYWNTFLANKAGNKLFKAHAVNFLAQLRENNKIDFGTRDP